MGNISKKMDVVLSQGPDLIEFYRDNPCIAAYDLLGVDLAPIQRVVFEDMWFKPYTLAVCSRGFGKSVYIKEFGFFMGKGLVYLDEVLPKVPDFLDAGEDIVIKYDDILYTDKGYRPIKNLCLEKQIKGKKVITQIGLVKRGSDHHPILTIDSACNLVYKRLDELTFGDRICIKRGQKLFGSYAMPFDDAYLLGILMGAGVYQPSKKLEIKTEEDLILKFLRTYCKDNAIPLKKSLPPLVLPGKPAPKKNNNFSFTATAMEDFIEHYMLKNLFLYGKGVPYFVRIGDEGVQKAFLKGFFDVSCNINKLNGYITCESTSKKLFVELQQLLLNFGVISSIHIDGTSKFEKKYKLEITSEEAYKYRKLIGFRIKEHHDAVLQCFGGKVPNTIHDTIPGLYDVCKQTVDLCKSIHGDIIEEWDASFDIPETSEIGYSFLEKLTTLLGIINNRVEDLNEVLDDTFKKLIILRDTHYYYDTVVSVLDWQGDCYDFEMAMEEGEEPNYITNGFINHNTFLSGVLASLLCLLYPGYRVGLIAPSFRQSLVISSTYDTFWTSEGLVTSTEKLFDIVEEGVTKVQSQYSQNTILSKWKNDERDCVKLKTTKGFELSGTADHGVLALDVESGKIGFKDMCDLNRGDYLLVKSGFNYFGDNNTLPTYTFEHDWRTKDCTIPTELTPDLAYLFGLLIGDGCISIDSTGRKYRIMFTSADPELLEVFESTMLKYFNIVTTDRNQKNRCPQITYYCKKLVIFLLECGFTKTTALDKKIPHIIKRSSKECFVSFIQGLMDTDGCCYVQIHKSGSDHCEVTLNTSSKQLAKEYQSFLLNVGVMSNLTIASRACEKKLLGRDKLSKCAESYKVRITGRRNLEKFNTEGLFKLVRKKTKLNNYIKEHFNTDISVANYLGLPQNIVDKNINTYKEYLDQDYYFVQVKSKEHMFAETMDIEVENESCYFSSGFISHNSKMLFAEVEKLYDQSPILREATVKRPIRGSDTCYLKFRSVSGYNGAFIEALPLGADGAKIRGSRFYCILIDEFAQVPQKIIETVLAPMSITKLDPMKKVRELERRKRLIEAGLATEEDFEEDAINKMIGTSSGYYKFNHMYKRMREYWRLIDEGSKDHAIFQVPYTLLPEGFLDEKNITNARRVMSDHEFRMEYMADMVSDSEGFFKASLLDDCTFGNDFKMEYVGDPKSSYIIGIDPNQGGSAKCGLVVVKLSGDFNRVVRVMALSGKTTQDITTAIQQVCDSYRVVRIFMDRGGGGKAVSDLLEEGYNGYEPILDRNKKENSKRQGRHILEVIAFNTGWISDANFATLALLEDKKVRFPEPPIKSIKDMDAEEYEQIEVLKRQCTSIVVTQTSGGALHFDTPKKGQNKDLYSAFILACYGIKALEHELDTEDDSHILFSSGGMVRQRDTSSWQSVQHPVASLDASVMSAALLTKKK